MTNLRDTGNNKQPFTVNFIDLNNDNASLAHLEEAKLSDLNVDQIIKALQQKGYWLVNNGFDPNTDEATYDFVVTFRHSYQIIDADHPTSEFPVKDLRRVGTQLVHYKGAGAKTPIDNKTELVLNRSLVYDRVEKKIIKDNGWDKKSYRVIGTPDVAGYVASKAYVGGDSIQAADPDRKYTVRYQINRQPSQKQQKAMVQYLDVDDDNKTIATSGEISGDPYTRIDYSPRGTINYLKNQGYKLLNNGFSANGEVQFFDNSDETTQTYIISLGHDHTAVSEAHPLNGINPSQYEIDRIAKVHYKGAGQNTPDDNTQIIKLSRTVTVDSVTKEVLSSTNWKPSKSNFASVTTPILRNYHADKKSIPSKLVYSDHLDEEVNYTLNGRIIPVDEDGNAIPDAPNPRYQTDPEDATQVLADEPVPELDAWTPRVESITPTDPSADTRVVYNKKLIVQLQALEDRGFIFVNNGLNADTVARSIDGDTHGPQTYVIGLAHGHQNVTPDHPGFPGQPINPKFVAGPKWPEGTGKKDLIRLGKQTIHYEGAGNMTPNDNEQDTEFDRTLVIDKVSGKVIRDNGWNANQRQFGTVTTPVLPGFYADKRIVGGKTVTPDHLEETVTVTYRPNGHIIPVDTNGKPIDGAEHVQYRTDPKDATKVVVNESVPNVAGYTPTSSAVTPSNPAQDTPIVYLPDAD